MAASLRSLALTALLLAAPALRAQQPAVAELRGKVLVNEQPAAGTMVVVHRVAAAGAGPIDSVRTGKDGGFRYRLPHVPDPDASNEVFFASVSHGGVSYFGPIVQTVADLDSLYVVRTYDTETAPAQGAVIPIDARYVLLEEAKDTGWMATDLIHFEYKGDKTLVAAPGGATFVYPLPEGASDMQVGGAEATPDQATIKDGALWVTSAIQPGEREFMVRYKVPSPYLTLRYPGETKEAELLVKEPAPPLDVGGLLAAPPVEMEPGVNYRRYAAGDLLNSTVIIKKGKGEPIVPTGWLAVGLALLLASAALYSVLRPHQAVASAAGAAPVALAGLSPFAQRQRLLLEVARLDEAKDQGRVADADDWAVRRRALLERIRELG